MKQADNAPDSLFFLQLLLPIHDTKRTGIPDDPRMPFYHKVAKWSNSYASNDLDIGNGYGHSFKNVTMDELVKWDGVIVIDGALGGSRGAILRRFDDSREDNLSYCKYVTDAFSKTRFLEVKRVMKLCDNSTAPKKGQPGYDPAYKYDYIFKCIVHNTNAITFKAGLDLCGDETTFGHMGFGPSDTGLLVRQKNKMVSKGCQLVLVSDVDRIRPRVYLHRHKMHKNAYTLNGPSEARMLWEKMAPLLVKDPTIGSDENEDPAVEYKPRAIFEQKPHFTFDNHFSGDEIMEYAAAEGFGLTMTCRRDRLPGGIPDHYFHQGKTNVQSKRTRAARWEIPIFAIKKCDNGALIQYVSFQSTSSCNIACVNALNSCNLFAKTKERGRGIFKRRWGIEMNEGRQLYLASYGVIDNIDHYLDNCDMFYRQVHSLFAYYHCLTVSFTPFLHFFQIVEILARWNEPWQEVGSYCCL